MVVRVELHELRVREAARQDMTLRKWDSRIAASMDDERRDGNLRKEVEHVDFRAALEQSGGVGT